MGVRTSYAPGTFSWVDLTAADVDAAKAFYTRLFGWEYEDNPVEDSVYAMALNDGHHVAAISGPAGDRPVVWASYVTVEDVDASAARAAELGGAVHAPPFDVMDAGRMAVVGDPQGAVFCMWQPRAHIGAGLVNTTGAFTWNELITSDREAAERFYTALFGWEVVPQEQFGDYHMFALAGRGNGGVTEITPEMGPHVRPYWSVCFGCDDVDATVAIAVEAGAQVWVEPTDGGPIRIAVLGDPQGAAFAVAAGDFEE